MRYHHVRIFKLVFKQFLEAHEKKAPWHCRYNIRGLLKKSPRSEQSTLDRTRLKWDPIPTSPSCWVLSPPCGPLSRASRRRRGSSWSRSSSRLSPGAPSASMGTGARGGCTWRTRSWRCEYSAAVCFLPSVLAVYELSPVGSRRGWCIVVSAWKQARLFNSVSSHNFVSSELKP